MDDVVDGPELSGLFLLGTFVGVSEGQFPKLDVDVVSAGPDGPVTRRHSLDFTAFDSRTGAANAVGKALQEVAAGDRIAVGVWQDVFEFTYKRDIPSRNVREGDVGHMIRQRATQLHRVG